MDIFDIQTIKNYILQRKIVWTNHCLNRINQRNISIIDIKKAINNGRIIEYYYEDYPHPSCLIVGHTEKNKILHIVCGMGENTIFIITAYYPNCNKWEKDMKTRRKEK